MLEIGYIDGGNWVQTPCKPVVWRVQMADNYILFSCRNDWNKKKDAIIAKAK